MPLAIINTAKNNIFLNKNGKKEKSCVLLKELSKIYDIMK